MGSSQSFGTFIPLLNDYQAPAPWQSAISQSPSIGSVFGVYWGGYLNDRFGYRKSLIINYFFVIPCIGETEFSSCCIMSSSCSPSAISKEGICAIRQSMMAHAVAVA
jgi:MFS family permease